MKYKPPIKGKGFKQSSEGMADFGVSKFVVDTMYELKDLKNSVEKTLNDKSSEVDTKVEQIMDGLDKTYQQFSKDVAEAKDSIVKFANNVIAEVHNLEQIEGRPGKDVDEELLMSKIVEKLPKKDSIVSEVISKIPPIDEKTIISAVLKKVPKSKSDLKIIKESVEIDPMSVIDKIMALPEEKRKKLQLGTSNINGLDQTISAFNNQIRRAGGYLHGGGISNITGLIQAGSGIDITGAGTKESPYVISATGGGGTIGGSIQQDQIAYGSALNTITGDNRHTIDSAGRTNLTMSQGGTVFSQLLISDNVFASGLPGAAIQLADSFTNDNASIAVLDTTSFGGSPYQVTLRSSMPSTTTDAILALSNQGVDFLWDGNTGDSIATGILMNESLNAGNPGAALARIDQNTGDAASVIVEDATGTGGQAFTVNAGYADGAGTILNHYIADVTGVYLSAEDLGAQTIGKFTAVPSGTTVFGSFDVANGYESSFTADVSGIEMKSRVTNNANLTELIQTPHKLEFSRNTKAYFSLDPQHQLYQIADFSGAGNGTYTKWDDDTGTISTFLDGEFTITNVNNDSRVALFQSGVRAAIGDIDATASEAIVDVDIASGNIYLYGNLHVDRADQAAGDTGDVTLNTQAGTVNFAAGMASLVLTNNRIISSSEILVSVSSNDATMKSAHTVKGTGSVTIYADALPTATTKVTFLVLN